MATPPATQVAKMAAALSPESRISGRIAASVTTPCTVPRTSIWSPRRRTVEAWSKTIPAVPMMLMARKPSAKSGWEATVLSW